MNKKTITEKMIEANQEKLFKPRYKNASISQISLPGNYGELLRNYVKKPKNMLVYTGNSGIGKTYLCCALTGWAMKNFSCYRYYKEQKLLSELRNNMQKSNGGDYIELLEILIDDDLVILDDVGSSGVNEWREEVFFNFLDYRYNTMKPTIITSNFNKKEFYERYSKRVGSRLYASENTIIEIENGIDLRQEGY